MSRYLGPWPAGVGGGAGPGGASEGIYAGGRILFVDPDHPDVQAPGGTDPTKPFTLIADALAAAGAIASALAPRTVFVAPGLYLEDLVLPRHVILQGMAGDGGGDRQFVHATIIGGSIVVDLATVTDLDDTWAALVDLRVTPVGSSPALRVTGIGAFRLVVTRCGFDANAVVPAVLLENTGVVGGYQTEVLFQDSCLAAGPINSFPLQVNDGYTTLRGGMLRGYDSGSGDAIRQNGGFIECRSGVIISGLVDLNDGYFVCLDETVLVAIAEVLDIAAPALAMLWSSSIGAGVTPAIIGTGALLYGLLEGALPYTGIASTLTRYTDGNALLGALGLGQAQIPTQNTVLEAAKSNAGYPGTDTQKLYLRKTTTNATPTAIDIVPGGGWPVADNTAVTLSIGVTAKALGGVQAFRAKQGALVYRNGAGAILSAASPWQTEFDNNGGAFTGDVEIGVSGNNITVTITGMALTTIGWTIDVVVEVAGAA